MKLWELSNEMHDLEGFIDEILEDDLSDEVKDQEVREYLEVFMNCQSAFIEKVDAIAYYINKLEVLAKAQRDKAKSLTELARANENRAKSIREYLISHMVATSCHKVETANGKLSLRKKPARVELVCCPEDLPEEFIRVKKEPDLTAIKQHLEQLPERTSEFACLVQNGFSLTMK
jgi:hypothetical protein